MNKEKIIEEVKKNTDLIRYPFDEFWFNVGFEKALSLQEKEFKKKIEEIKNNCVSSDDYYLALEELLSQFEEVGK